MRRRQQYPTHPSTLAEINCLETKKLQIFVTSRPGSTRAFEDSGGTNIQVRGRIIHTSQSIYTKRLECLAMNVNVILRNAYRTADGEDGEPYIVVYRGTIASGELVVKNAILRDR